MGILLYVHLGIPQRPGEDLAESPSAFLLCPVVRGYDVPQSPQAPHRAGHVDDFGTDNATIIVAQLSYFHQGEHPLFRIVGRRCFVLRRRFAFALLRPRGRRRPVVGMRRTDFHTIGLLFVMIRLKTKIGPDTRRRGRILLLFRLFLGFQEPARPSAAAPRRSRRTLLPVLLLRRFG